MGRDAMPETVSVDQVTGKPPARRVETVEGWVIVGPDGKPCEWEPTFFRREPGHEPPRLESNPGGWAIAPATLTIHHQEGDQ